MVSTKVWTSMVDLSEKFLFDRVNPNKTLVEQALSFNAAELETVSDGFLRQYMVVLGQYLITLQYEENRLEAARSSWKRALDSHIYSVMVSGSFPPNNKKLTVAEKREWVIQNDEQAASLNNEYQVAESEHTIIKSMHKPVEQYINTLKKEVDARESDKRRG